MLNLNVEYCGENFSFSAKDSKRKERKYMYSSAYVWAKILGYMEEQLGAVVISTWFDDAEVVELTEEQLILHTPSDYRRDYITQRCASYVQDALKCHVDVITQDLRDKSFLEAIRKDEVKIFEQ